MKIIVKIALLIIAFSLNNNVYAQWGNPWGDQNQGRAELSTNKVATISWDKTSHNFGDVKQFNEQKVEYTFTNNGDKPILITKAEASCGCTKLEYSKAPILPGKTGSISTVFDAKEEGLFQKTITVYLSLDAPNDIYELKLTGNVVK